MSATQSDIRPSIPRNGNSNRAAKIGWEQPMKVLVGKKPVGGFSRSG